MSNYDYDDYYDCDPMSNHYHYIEENVDDDYDDSMDGDHASGLASAGWGTDEDYGDYGDDDDFYAGCEYGY